MRIAIAARLAIMLACLVVPAGAQIGPAGAQVVPACPVPSELKPDPAPLPATKARIAAREEVRVVALAAAPRSDARWRPAKLIRIASPPGCNMACRRRAGW